MMDRIEGLLYRLTAYQNEVTYYSEVDDLALMREAQGKRNRLSTQIAADWRAMVEALEKYEMAERCADKHGVAAVMTIELLTEAYEAGHTVLARVKGEPDA